MKLSIANFVKMLEEIDAKGYLVGGAVRDKMLADIKGLKNCTPKDQDYVVTGVSQKVFEGKFPGTKLVGKSFPVYLLEIEGEKSEVALARMERKVGVGYKGFNVITSPDLTIEHDLLRRDLTINSMAINLHNGELIDPFAGKKDLEKGLLRRTSPAFSEDPLRVYRVARFAAQLGMMPDNETLEDMKKLRDELSTISPERVVEELKKALASDMPSLFWEVLELSETLDVHFPELHRLKGLNQPKAHHPEGDVDTHVKQVMDAGAFYAKRMPQKENETSKQFTERIQMVVLGSMLHDVGKFVAQGINPKTGENSYHKHEALGVPIVEDFCDKFGIVKWKNALEFATKNHGLFHRDILNMKSKKFVDFIEGSVVKEKIGDKMVYKKVPGLRDVIGIEEYIAICSADHAGRNEEHNHVFQRVLQEEHPNAEFLRVFAEASQKIKHNVDISKFEGGEISYQIYMDLRKQRIELHQQIKEKMSDLQLI